MIKLFKKIRQQLIIENKFSKYLIYALSIILLFFISSFKSHQIIDPIEAGKQIYTQGTSPSKSDIMAVISGVVIPGSIFTCINCHGPNGEGMPEGGIKPSNIQWEVLSQNPISTNGRKHPAYSNSGLAKAIAMGIDPAGNILHTSMPKYQMTRTDMNYLIAYIKTLGKEE